VQNLFKEL